MHLDANLGAEKLAQEAPFAVYNSLAMVCSIAENDGNEMSKERDGGLKIVPFKSPAMMPSPPAVDPTWLCTPGKGDPA